ncbi:patatin family protein [Gemmiger formicilis]|uniref:patatin-like phospholipase family protein n=1 Tax=Gemmiger formicilis TaxID=745368 RepID=UPI001956C44F|nr:patatin family protein [Gemmiger formicilis]MBM6899537.1 patatin family protein [Gemmiger formicilis]
MDNFVMPQSTALLLEGGSLRGLYTAGALDTLMEREIYFPAVAGVSAGALNAVNYVAHQPGRSASINLRYRKDPRYFGPMAAFYGGSLFGLNFMLKDLSQSIPFDFDTFYHGSQRMVAVATCVQTGKPAYFEKGKTDFDFFESVRASASLPLVSVPVRLGKFSYLDGGCSCPIPLHWAQTEGFEKTVIITTRQKGFRKTPPSQRMINLYDDFYGRNALFMATLLTQEVRYNALMEEIDALEEAGKIFVLRPADPVDISRFEKDTDKLLNLYNRGRREMREQLDALEAYLQK